MRWASGLPIPIEDKLWEWSPVYHGANAGKRVINLDLNSDAGREIAFDLITDADVIIENYSPRVTETWGFTGTQSTTQMTKLSSSVSPHTAPTDHGETESDSP